jgi:hypothetical protein
LLRDLGWQRLEPEAYEIEFGAKVNAPPLN